MVVGGPRPIRTDPGMGGPIPLHTGPVDMVNPLKKGTDPDMGSHKGMKKIGPRMVLGMEEPSNTDPVMGGPKERSSLSMDPGMEEPKVKDMDLGMGGPKERMSLQTGLDMAGLSTDPVMEGPKGRISLPMGTVVMKRRNRNQNHMDMVQVRKVMVGAGMVVVTQAMVKENIRAMRSQSQATTVEKRKDMAVRNM